MKYKVIILFPYQSNSTFTNRLVYCFCFNINFEFFSRVVRIEMLIITYYVYDKKYMIMKQVDLTYSYELWITNFLMHIFQKYNQAIKIMN